MTGVYNVNDNPLVEAEVIEEPQNTAKQSKLLTNDTSEDHNEVSEYFTEVVKPNKVVPDAAATQEGEHSSFDDFDDFKDETHDEAPSGEIEVYEPVMEGESDVLLSTGDLAKMFGVTNQTIRNTENFFIEILSDERGADGRKLYTSEDVQIIRKIFYMSGTQKYKRREIRDYLLKNGISAKNNGSNFTTEVKLDGLPTAGNKPAVKNEEMQLKLNDAMLSLKDALSEKLTEGLITMQDKISKDITAELRSNSKYISENLDKTKAELMEIIKTQENALLDQKNEIIKLKGTIININHTALEIDKTVKNITSSDSVSSEDLQNIVSSIDSLLKESNPADAVQESIESIRKQSQNDTKKIVDEIAKQGQTLEKLEKNVVKIEQNSTKDKQSNIKNDVADSLNKNYQKVENALNNNLKAQKEVIDSKLIEIRKLIEDAQNNTVDTDTIDSLNKELSSALLSVEELQKTNSGLEKEYNNSKDIIAMQAETIKDLQRQVAALNDATSDSLGTASSGDNSELRQKIKVAKAIIDKLTAENNELQKKSQISQLIIKKQDEKIRSFENKVPDAVLNLSSDNLSAADTQKRNTEPLDAEKGINTESDDLSELLMDN